MIVEYNRSAIECHIKLLTRQWIEDGLSALLEIRCLQDKGRSKSLYVDPTDADFLDDAITKVCDLNQAGWNAYICVNPMDNTNVGPANDEAIVAAYFVFADADDGEGINQYKIFIESFVSFYNRMYDYDCNLRIWTSTMDRKNPW